MKLLTKALQNQLLKNGREQTAEGRKDFRPVVKLFGGGACTWLLTELDADGDTAFGLCDLGMGEPEMGIVSLRELAAARFRPFGLGVERDLWFTADKTLSEYATEARLARRICA